MTLQIRRLPKSRCRHFCDHEASIHGSGTGRAKDKKPKYNSRCAYCEKAFNSDSYRCYCCGMPLRKRRSVRDNLKFKEELIVRI